MLSMTIKSRNGHAGPIHDASHQRHAFANL
jgi:hypothetical protein